MRRRATARSERPRGFRIDTGDSERLLRPGPARERRRVFLQQGDDASCAGNAISRALPGAAF